MKREEKEEQFVRLIEQNRSMILMMCRAYAPSREETDDYFQEVVVRLWQGFDSFRGDAALSTWVYRITLNTCISQTRKSSCRFQTVPLLDNVDLEEESNVDARNTARLYELINALNRYEKALVLLWLENLPYSEIAEIMGLTVSNVSVKLARIKDKLKSMSNNNQN